MLYVVLKLRDAFVYKAEHFVCLFIDRNDAA
jgi:hypothetical protein